MIQAVRSSFQLPEPNHLTAEQLDLPTQLYDPPNLPVDTQKWNESIQCIHQWFEAQVDSTPNAISLSFDGQHLPYETLNQRANQLAHCLLHQGLQPQELVVISTHRSLEMVIAYLGVLKAGGAYVPLDPEYPAERRAYQLRDVQARFILTQKSLVDSLPQHTASVISLDSDWQLISSFSAVNPDVCTTADHLAYVIYTSGSTGLPKGVMVPHRGVVNHSRAITRAFEISDRDRVLQFSSMSFDVTVEQLYPALVSGATVILRSEDVLSSTRHFLQFVEQQNITVLLLPVAFWHEWVNGMALLKRSVPASIRLVAVGGEKPSRSIYAQWRKLVGDYPRWLNGYGPTETTVTATLYDPIAAHYDPSQGDIPIGKAITNAEVHILNGNLESVPQGECGELYIGGLGVARGYLNLPDQTAERFISNPFSTDPQSRLYKTGDRVRCSPDGNLEFLGRYDFQVKVRGFRIELSEIEVQLEQFAPIQQAIVLAQDDHTGNSRLVAYLKLHPSQKFNPDELRSFLQQKLPDYMIPTAFVKMETFPTTVNGKVNRQALPAPQSIEIAEDRAIVAPTTATEAQLVQIWEEVLGINGVGITDNFFELGGHSLLVAQLSNQIFQAFGVDLPLSILLQAPTIAQLAAVLSEPLQVESVVLLRLGGNKPPVFLIHDGDGETLLYRTLAHQLDPERSIYGIQPCSNANHPILHTRIADMASDYLQKIRSIQPEGPYYLGGLCAGGVLAYEVACQLQQQGQMVSMVALFDAVYPALDRSQWVQNQRRDRLAKAMGQDQSITLLNLIRRLTTLIKKARNLLHYEVTSFLQRNLDETKLRLFRHYLDQQQTPPQFLGHILVRKTYLFAEAEYAQDIKLEGRLVLLRATQGEGGDHPYQEIYTDPELGWGQHVTQKVDVYDVPGGHSSMLQLPHVKVIADILQTYLNDLNSDSGLCLESV
ncbi:amino acid adenylation domain-containing protein [Phormidium sp. CLA17]|uniref:non-ribosomal peptide synthetase n=1 Tax=Leptolyngbya sp. Cla-17 TaxID=2803751 RepID=UPI0014930A7B|nr:amino acid adenylation domain-containing protein [Leptolyngbya sp. Cla-17]MBM0743313.1 amino acid adenylation domain-containing protein [Leptolyngbya sp. Cla-17]